MAIVDSTVAITGNAKLNAEYFLLEFCEPTIAANILPGQFVNIDVKSPQCLLRRPFSIFDVTQDRIQILYKAVGKGTTHLASLPKGSMIDVLGPLGKGYTMPQTDKTIFLIGGGTGIASLHFLFRRLQKTGSKNIYFGVGLASKKLHIPLVEQNVGDRLRVYTEDGSLGEKGYVPELLRKAKGSADNDNIFVYACGPHAMIKALPNFLGGITEKTVEVSLEERMACGLGACLGCMVETVNGARTVCKDGPVFRLDELKF